MSSRKQRSFASALERLEPRIAMTAAGGLALGTVVRPFAPSVTSVDISPANLTPRRHATVFSVAARPAAGSPVLPVIDGASDGASSNLPLLRGTPYRAGHSPARAYAKVSAPGPLATRVAGAHGTTGDYVANTTLPGDVNGDGKVNALDAQRYVKAVPSFRQLGGKYDPAADFNGNGFVGIGDGKLLLRNSVPTTPKRPLSVQFHLGPDDQIAWDGSKNSGGKTVKQDVTILGHTTPGTIIFSDAAPSDYTFRGPAYVADESGNFRVPVHLKEGLNNFDFLAIDAHGQQVVRDFPIFWVAFAAGKIN